MNSDTFFYGASGLTLRSEIALQGMIPVAFDRQPDVTVRRGRVPATLEDATVSGPTWQMIDRRFLLSVPGVARFQMESGRDIVVDAEEGIPSAEVAIFLIGTVLGILLHQRGRIVLHASAVCVNEKAVIFCGSSGMGKSTMAAALGARGYDLLTDDLCAIEETPSRGHVVHPDGRLLKLWDHAIDQLGMDACRRGAVRESLKKYYVQPQSTSLQALPLGAIYILREARPPHEPGIERLNAVDASVGIRRSAYRPLLVRHMGQQASYFRAATSIANQAGVFHLTRALDFRGMPDLSSALERHWSDIGLTEHQV